MTTELQNKIWACLPKEAREKVRYEYRKTLYQQVIAVLEYFFGHHNLTSDAEPSEMLYVERKRVQEVFAALSSMANKSAVGIIYSLFGDKCLPGKIELSVQGEPKFKVGDKVMFATGMGDVYIIEEIRDKYIVIDRGKVYPSNMFVLFEHKKYNNMEEKELNLCELLKPLLKGCKDIEVYSLLEGEVFVYSVTDSLIETSNEEYGENGEKFMNGLCLLYPSRALYEKYPLDAYSAWMEWKSERTPKRWRAEEGEYYWRIVLDKDFDNYIADSADVRDSIDNACYEVGNYFRTEEKAQQAAEAVRECLMKFHKQIANK